MVGPMVWLVLARHSPRKNVRPSPVAVVGPSMWSERTFFGTPGAAAHAFLHPQRGTKLVPCARTPPLAQLSRARVPRRYIQMRKSAPPVILACITGLTLPGKGKPISRPVAHRCGSAPKASARDGAGRRQTRPQPPVPVSRGLVEHGCQCAQFQHITVGIFQHDRPLRGQHALRFRSEWHWRHRKLALLASGNRSTASGSVKLSCSGAVANGCGLRADGACGNGAAAVPSSVTPRKSRPVAMRGSRVISSGSRPATPLRAVGVHRARDKKHGHQQDQRA